MYKWFIWSPKLQKYIAIPGLITRSRSFFGREVLDCFGNPIGVCFSIPFSGPRS